MNNYIVYMHISPSGKRYIGITSQKVNQRWKNGKGYKGNQYFYRAIEKYGWENFEHIIIATDLSEEQAKEMEIELIAEYDTTNRDKGYNKSPGGDTISEDARKKLSENNPMKNPKSRKKLSEAKKGKKRPDISGENHPFYGKNPRDFWSEETKRERDRKVSEAMKGKTHTEETKRKISEAHKGKNPWENMTDEQKEERKRKLSEAMSGENNPMYGKKRPEISERMSGENNPMYGRRGENNPMYGKKRPEISGKDNPSAKSVICLTTNMIFDTMKEGAEEYGIKDTGICQCCKGKIKSSGKYNGIPLVWRYITIIEL